MNTEPSFDLLKVSYDALKKSHTQLSLENNRLSGLLLKLTTPSEEAEKTSRGFSFRNFTDRNGLQCSIQQSSLATEEAIWFGIDKPKLTVFKDETFGQYETTEMPKLYQVDSRMHLTREQVEMLLPTLVKFVQTGKL